MRPALRRFLYSSAILLPALFICCTAPAQAQDAAPAPLRLNGRELKTAANAAGWLDSFGHTTSGQALVVVQFKQTPDEEVKSRLRVSGIVLHSFLTPLAAIAGITPRSSYDAAIIRSITSIEGDWKIAPVLAATAGAAMADVLIACVPGTSDADLRARVTLFGGSMKAIPLNEHSFFEASLPASKLAAFAKWPAVLSVGPAAKDVPLNLESARATKVNVVRAPVSSGGYGLLGDSVTVGVGDISCGLYHVDTRDRVVNYNYLPYNNHGQHVTGTVGGAGTLDPLGEGFAPHVQLIDHYFNLVWQRTGPMLAAHNMTVTNNSYSSAGAPTVAAYCANSGSYDAYAQALDSIALLYPTVLHVFAAGNDGGTSCPPFITGYSTIPAGYQAAKNIIVVANSRKFYQLNAGSSRGPLRDGRLRPDIAAIGSYVYSCKGLDIYLSAIGTSMASPQVAGAAALLQQHYKHLNGGAYPLSVLTKNLLMNAAQDLGPAGPDFEYGYGMMDLQRSLKMLDNGWHTSGTISNGGNQTPATIAVPANTAQLKVMLSWNDVPASALATTQLVNDLDLKVTDPASGIHLPYVLNPAPTHVADAATRGADHLNNVEQVVIDNPAAGSYAVGVSGYAVPSGPQGYVVTYDMIPKGISLTTPFTGEAYKANSLLEVYWTASDDPNTFTIDYSTDGGTNWSTLINNVPAGERRYTWSIPAGVNSSQCMMRITRNVTGEQFVTGNFTVNDEPMLSLMASQCPGYVNLSWSRIQNATGYNVLRKVGYYLQPVATTTDTFFYASSLRPDSIYYFAVQPVFGGAKGFRSTGVSRRPDNGSCAGTYSDGDLIAEQITAPATGRAGTSTALTANETLTLQVRNLDDAAAGSYKVSYQLNGGAWQSQTLSSLAPASTATVSFTGLNMAVAGTYTIKAAIQNLSAVDPAAANDTVVKVLRQLPNPVLTLSATGISEDFESLPAITLMQDTMGFAGGSNRWDFANAQDTGRLRSFVDNDITISGARSLSMDIQYQSFTPSYNLLTGTFNLASYNISTDELRLEFDYKLHGHPKSQDSNKVWVRGSDTQPWTELMAYDRSADPGAVVHSGSRSVTDALLAASQTVGTSMQVAFGQRDTSVIAGNSDGSGLTLDNIRLYLVTKDVGLTAVTAPAAVSCGLSAATPLSVTIFNGVATAAANVGMHYQLDGGTVVDETLASLAGKSNQTYTFTQTMNAAGFGLHTVKVWVTLTGDDCATNDTLIYGFRNEPLIATFPYLQDFEGSDGYWWPAGLKSSWEWGAPVSTAIHKAASGAKAWKTNLNGNYFDGELSYLYSPCFDISGLSNPMLSFSLNMELEDCGSSLCDGAWVEYSVNNGSTWTKLGASGQGTNWYSSAAFQVWNIQTPVRWRVASIPLPASAQPVRFRFVMASDPGASFNGIALDDIHIFDRNYAVYAGGNTGPVAQTVSGSGFTSFTSGGAVLAQISAGSSSSLGNTDVTLYTHDVNSANALQYYVPKNFVVNTQNAPTDSVTARLFITDADVLALVNAGGCAACTKPGDAYRLGITKYDNANNSLEDSSLANNGGGTSVFIPYSRVRWVPYDAGYYAEFRVASFSELWFNDGGPGALFPLPIVSLEFDARKSGESTVLATWLSRTDTQVTSYELQRSSDAKEWAAIATIASFHDVAHQYSYTDAPGTRVVYYRIKYKLRDASSYFSTIRQVIFSGGAADLQVYPNPTTDGTIILDWSTQPGTQLDATITDITGRIMTTLSTTAADYSNRSTLELGDAAKGIYFLHATISGERFDLKVQRQ